MSFGKIQTEGFTNLAVSSAAISDGSLVDRNFSDTPGISLSKLKTGPLPTNILTGTSNYVAASVTYPKLNFEKNALGVGIWLDWSPVVYLATCDINNRTQAINFPGQVISSGAYSVLCSKYLKINNLCLVNLHIAFNTSMPQSSGVISFSLPLMPLTSEGMVVGTSLAKPREYPPPESWYIGLGNNLSTCPIIWKNLLTLTSVDDMSEVDGTYSETLQSAAKTPGQSTQEDLLTVLGDLGNRAILCSIAYEVAV